MIEEFQRFVAFIKVYYDHNTTKVIKVYIDIWYDFDIF